MARVEVDLASGRKEKNKAAYDYLYTMKDEIDWTMMAKFQAEWSKKFYDVFVPRLIKFNEQYKSV